MTTERDSQSTALAEAQSQNTELKRQLSDMTTERDSQSAALAEAQPQIATLQQELSALTPVSFANLARSIGSDRERVFQDGINELVAMTASSRQLKAIRSSTSITITTWDTYDSLTSGMIMSR
jgi:chromosome segregation ATPase